MIGKLSLHSLILIGIIRIRPKSDGIGIHPVINIVIEKFKLECGPNVHVAEKSRRWYGACDSRSYSYNMGSFVDRNNHDSLRSEMSPIARM